MAAQITTGSQYLTWELFILMFIAFVQGAPAAGAGFGFFAGTRGWGLLLIIGFVKPAAFKYYTATLAYQTIHLTLTIGALFYRSVLHRLKKVELLTAF